MTSVTRTHPIPSPSIDHNPLKQAVTKTWNGFGLDKQVIKNLEKLSLVPEEIHKRIILSILKADHLEIIVPPDSHTTTAIQAALISYLITSSSNDHTPAPTQTSPMVLILCMNTHSVERHTLVCKQLGTDIGALDLEDINHSECLSTDLEIARRSVDSPIWITTLPRAGLLLQQQALSLNRLSILLLDLRHSNHLNHHTLAELEPLINSLGPHVQLIFLISLNTRVSPALSQSITQKMESSIRINLSNQNTPALTPTSLSPTPSHSVSQIPSPPSYVTSTNSIKVNTQDDYQAMTTFNNQLKRHHKPNS
ncbi:hypothetical protein PGT21_035446 [Puccinia graminis f. sp. tritici]|uniref:Uncharacterized protein n=1 Tax=Puccinia graminis f. sp. tritici TaxID=56615 RepID=A0A5B0NSR9_PUCGR|nr:hypothetical protein PGTUg99_036757 [Puccinia graminis f. sp. tritici]KAA1091544.1 hypothetical protein PGT21_035446 [Puccinia graminis f. sp. tritici]